MSAIPQLTHGMPNVVSQELNTTNVAADYHDHSTTYHDRRVFIGSTSHIKPLDRLLDRVSYGALHDSAERGGDAPKCYPETRTAVQRDIMSWIQHGDEDDTPKKILWLSGPAGSGKTAIAGTIADECYKRGLLAASFFFSAFYGDVNRRLKKPVIPTLVYRLIQHKSIVGLKKEVLAVIENDPGVFERHIDQQIEELVLKPFRKLAARSNPNRDRWPAIILIDGLDECQGSSESDVRPGGNTQSSGSNAQREILSALLRACADPAFPFRIIIASRPELVIRHSFSSPSAPVLNIFLNDKYDPDADIRLFLEAMLSDIGRRYNLPLTWIPKDVIDLLVEGASGQFIYAATVIRFLDNTRLGAPQQQLNRLLEWRRLGNSEPFASLDVLYSGILHTSPDPLLAVGWLLFLDHHFASGADDPSGFHVYLKMLLESYPGETEYVLGNLTSLVGLVDERGRPSFHFHHKSLVDFLWDPYRGSDLHINEESFTRFVQGRYYQFLRSRGHESNADPLINLSTQDFRTTFCQELATFIDPRRRYTPGDVEWWVANLRKYDRVAEVPRMFASIHQQCKWYHCLPACSVWRKAIRRYCREHGWRVPTAKEKWRDRFKKLRVEATHKSLQNYPLRSLTIETTRGDPSP